MTHRGLHLARRHGMPAWQILPREDRLELVGELRLSDAAAIWRELRGCAAPHTIDVTRVTAIDGTVMALLAEITRGTRVALVGASPQVAQLAHLYLDDDGHPIPIRRKRPLEQLGAATRRLGDSIVAAIRYSGELASATGAVLRGEQRVNWRELPALIERAGADGIPIVVLLNFLIGFVGAYQSITELRQFGANIYVADVIGESVTRELAPLITAIIISGRSGAAFAAELGTMRVSEEIDALRTMGIGPLPYLVMPRVIALALVAPVLTLLGDVMGVFGGLVVAVASLGITPHGYVSELRTIVVPWDVLTGLIKSFAFAIAIALIGCRQGLTARGAAAGVGRGTTSTVVECLFAVVTLDTVFTILFRGLGI